MASPSPAAAATSSSDPIARIRSAVRADVKGKDDVVELALTAMLAGGHLLLEDLPGVGKSTLARALAHAGGGTFARIQFTSDLLPGDLLGSSVWQARKESFEFHPGPIFANFVLADEVNRAPPRTQSALLEAMGEGQVSIDGRSRALPEPFMVIATQNPEEHHGTYPLPESQRDRFTLRLSMGYAAPEIEAALLVAPPKPTPLDGQDGALSLEMLTQLQQQAAAVHLHPDLAVYAQSIVGATRTSAKLRLGVSTRGALAWAAAARARALLDARSHVIADDLQDLAIAALAHRVVTSRDDRSSLVAAEVIRDIVAQTPVPQ